MLRKALMAATILLLLLLVLITPRLLGVREDLSTIPRLIVNYNEDEEGLVLYLTSLAGTYLYRKLYLNFTSEALNFTLRENASDSHGLEYRVDSRLFSGQFQVAPFAFDVEAAAVDRRSAVFDLALHVTATPQVEEGDRSWRFEFLFGEETQPRVVTDRDLLNTPLATFLERREAP